MYSTRANLPVKEIERSLPPGTIFTAYSGVKLSFGEIPSDYSEVWVYADDVVTEEIQRRFKKNNLPRNLIVVKPDIELIQSVAKFSKNQNAVPIPQLYVDLWNIPTWYSREFLNFTENRSGVKMLEFWNSDITNKSWEMLLDFSKKYDFILIGGWAIYLYSHLQKSRDIDIITSYESFSILSNSYTVQKNDILRRYEIRLNDFDVDIYLPYFSRLALPLSDIIESYSTLVENIKVPIPEALLSLKLGAFSNRYNSIKGDKDRLDLVGLLSVVDIDMSILRNIFIKYNLRNYPLLLKNALSGIDYKLLPYIKQNENTFSKLKRDLINRIDRTDWTSSTI